jgi:hypothetical protein
MFLKLRRFFIEASRPPAWKEAARDWKKANPVCAVCGLRKTLEAHDVLPYHLIEDPWSKPYEFWIKNFITLCHHDHHRFAHCGDPEWLAYQPEIRRLAETVKKFSKLCRK